MQKMSKAFHMKDIEKQIKEKEQMVANETDSKRKKKLEQELEYLHDLKQFAQDAKVEE